MLGGKHRKTSTCWRHSKANNCKHKITQKLTRVPLFSQAPKIFNFDWCSFRSFTLIFRKQAQIILKHFYTSYAPPLQPFTVAYVAALLSLTRLSNTYCRSPSYSMTLTILFQIKAGTAPDSSSLFLDSFRVILVHTDSSFHVNSQSL